MRFTSAGLALIALACSEPQQLESSDTRVDGTGPQSEVDSNQTRMCVTPSGTVYVAWADDRSGLSAVWLNTSPDGETWAGPVQVSHSPASATTPDLACTDDVVYVAWEDTRDGELSNPNIYFNRSGPGGTSWSPEDVRISPDEDGDTVSRKPKLAAAGTSLYLTWYDNPHGAYDVFVVSSQDSGVSWTVPSRLDVGSDKGSAFSGNPVIAADAAGHAVVAWEDSRDGGTDIYASSTQDGGLTWRPEVRLDTSPGDAPGGADSFAPRIALKGELVYVVWQDQRNGIERDIYTSFSNNYGQNWVTEARRVDSDSAGFFDSIRPSVSITEGRAWIAWQDARSTGYDTYVRDTNGGNFDAAEFRVDTDGQGESNSLEPLVVTEGQTIVVVWQDRRADDEAQGYNDLYYNYSFDAGLTWATDDLRIDSLAAGSSYAIEVNAEVRDGILYTAWTDGRRGHDDVFFHALPVGEEAAFTF